MVCKKEPIYISEQSFLGVEILCLYSVRILFLMCKEVP
jgi:hypothetical protein